MSTENDDDLSIDDVVLAILIISVGVVAGFAAYVWILPANVCVQKRVVVSIGGCQEGGCGVQFDDGTYGAASYPVPGKSVCTKWSQ